MPQHQVDIVSVHFVTLAYFNSQCTTGHAIRTRAGVPALKAIPRLSTMFTGRDDILERLTQCLNPSTSSVALRKQRIFVLYGLGGTGKTQIMAKFVDECGDQYDSSPIKRDPNDLNPDVGSGTSTLSTLAPTKLS